MRFSDILKKSGVEKELIYVALGNMVSVLLGAILWLILASLLQSEEYGQINYVVSVGTFASSVSTLGLNLAVMALLKRQPEIGQQSSILILISLSISIIPLFLITSSAYIVLLMLSTATFTMSTAHYLGAHRQKRYATLMITQKIIQIGLGIGMFFFIGPTGILIGYIFSYAVTSLPFFRNLKWSLGFHTLIQNKRMITHSYSLEIARAINMHSDKLLIAPLFGFSILGLYQFAAQFLLFLGIIPTIIYSYLLPLASSQMDSKRILFLGVGTSTIAAVSVFFASPYLVKAIFPNFVSAIDAIRILIWGIIPMTITSIFSSRYLSRENSMPVFFGAIVYITFQVGLLLIFGEMWGIAGLSFGIVTALVMQCIFLGIFGRISFKHRNDRMC